MKLLVSANAAWNLANYRSGLLARLVGLGHEVVAAAPFDPAAASLSALGVRFVPLEMAGHGTKPFEEAALYARYRTLFDAERPDAYFGFTIKPNIYGAFAAHRSGAIPLLTVTGLGAVYGRTTPFTLMVRALYRRALHLAQTVFFQNSTDAARFSLEGAEVLPGSGVDLSHFAPPARPADGCHFLFLGRLMRQKGVFEFVEAAARVRAIYPAARFTLMGPLSDGVDGAALKTFAAAGVHYGGETRDVRTAIAAADCLVLPSAYQEGTPRGLLEGAAMARSLIVSDHPGCRDTVRPGRSGYVVPPRSAPELTAAMIKFCALLPVARTAMGFEGRAHMAARFDERFVLARYEAALGAVLK